MNPILIVDVPRTVRLPNYPYDVDMEAVLSRSRVDRESIVFVCAFGSAVKIPLYSERRKWLWFRERVRLTGPANDADFLVAVKKAGLREYKIESGLPLRYAVPGGYNIPWVIRDEPGALHVLVSDIEAMLNALRGGDADAVSILKGSQFICGNKGVYQDSLLAVLARG